MALRDTSKSSTDHPPTRVSDAYRAASARRAGGPLGPQNRLSHERPAAQPLQHRLIDGFGHQSEAWPGRTRSDLCDAPAPGAAEWRDSADRPCGLMGGLRGLRGPGSVGASGEAPRLCRSVRPDEAGCSARADPAPARAPTDRIRGHATVMTDTQVLHSPDTRGYEIESAEASRPRAWCCSGRNDCAPTPRCEFFPDTGCGPGRVAGFAPGAEQNYADFRPRTGASFLAAGSDSLRGYVRSCGGATVLVRSPFTIFVLVKGFVQRAGSAYCANV
jgi:hypothetical protein